MNNLQLNIFIHQYHLENSKNTQRELVKKIKRAEGTFKCFHNTAENFDKKYQSLWKKVDKK